MKKLIKPLCLLTGLLCAPAVLLHAQVDEKLKADIVSTGYVHSPLPLDETKAFETFGLKKKVLETVMLCDMEDFSKWSHKGIGKIAECTPEQQAELIAQDPDYGEMICSCEEVTKAEILQAIHNPLGVSTMTGIKYRTRAMMGGCQGGFCQMKIENFIEQELGTEPEDVRYSRQGSWVLTGTMRKEEN